MVSNRKENCADEVAAVSSESEETTGHSIVSTVHSYQCFDMNSSPQGS